MMFLSQKPYLPLGSLREALFYPAVVRNDGVEVSEVLDLCGLSHLRDHLAEEGNWSQTLSPGEQQRIAARIFLLKPTHVFLDEATESRLYGTLKERLPGSVLISVGHRSTILAWHRLHLTLGSDGSWRFQKTATA